MSRRAGLRVALALLTMSVTLGHAAVAGADADALWSIVDGRCVPDQRNHGNPAPCAEVSPGPGGHAVLKDLVGATQFLLIPTDRIAGIEDPALLRPGSPNYFQAAWEARRFVEQQAREPLPRDVVGLAVNSAAGRTQDQLHIHVDCVRADVRDAVARRLTEVGPVWAPFPESLAGHRYEAMSVGGDTLTGGDPVVLLADGLVGARTQLATYTLVVLGVFLPDGRPGFVLLTDRADPATGNRAVGEELQDHASCPPPRGSRST